MTSFVSISPTPEFIIDLIKKQEFDRDLQSLKDSFGDFIYHQLYQ